MQCLGLHLFGGLQLNVTVLEVVSPQSDDPGDLR